MSNATHLLNLLPEFFLQQSKDHAVVLLDKQGTIVVWSAGAENVYGYRSDEVVGKPISVIFTPEDVERGLAAHEIAVTLSTGSMEDDRWMYRKDGSRIWVTGILTALQFGGEVVGLAKVMRNRTDLKVMVESLENQVATLRKAAEQQSQAFAIVGHELRNPLAPLVSAADLLGMSIGESSELYSIVQIIQRQSGILKKIVDDLLDVARMAEGKFSFEKVTVDLGQVISEAAASCQVLLDERRHEFKLLLAPTPIHVAGDATRLNQVFVNLINNAAKYTPDGGQISVAATLEGNDAVVVIEDNGVGIAPEVLPKIFELFTQEGSGDTRQPGGLGVGLALVKQLATLHGGTVSVRSDGKNKGSVFTVRLPLVE